MLSAPRARSLSGEHSHRTAAATLLMHLRYEVSLSRHHVCGFPDSRRRVSIASCRPIPGSLVSVWSAMNPPPLVWPGLGDPDIVIGHAPSPSSFGDLV